MTVHPQQTLAEPEEGSAQGSVTDSAGAGANSGEIPSGRRDLRRRAKQERERSQREQEEAGWAADAEERSEERVRRARSGWWLPGTVLTIVGFAVVGLVVHVALLSSLSYARAQQLSYDELRAQLVAGTAPVGPTFVPLPDELTGAAPAPTDPAPPPVAPALHPPGTPIALMSIPSIGINDVVVLEGTESPVTQQGLGHTRETSFPGQVGWSQVIGRHWSYGGPLQDAAGLLPGDDILFTTGQGQSRYEVTGLRRAGDPIPIRQPDQGRLVLVTADGRPFMAEAALYVDAILRTTPQPAGSPAIIPANDDALPMHGDTTAWFAILLWAQGLALAAAAVTLARSRWGRRQAWIVGVPLLTALGVGLAGAITQLLPNVL